MSVEVVYETHSLTIDNEAGRATGWLDGELSERGRQLATELGARRRSDGIAVVYTSDLGRAVETAAIAFGGSGIPVVRDRRLRECNFGRLNGCARAQLDRCGPTGVDEPYPQGESWREAITRVIDFLDEVVRSRDGERILLIGHMSAWYALECVSKRERIEQALDRRMTWQPGWEYTLSCPLGTPSETVRT